MGILDLLPHCVSGVYFIYHSDFEKWSFGKLSAMHETALALEGGYDYYYMGYYIHSCIKMRYKGEYKPSYLLDPETYDWNPLDGELRTLLDSKTYVSLSRERRQKEGRRETRTAPDGENESDSDSSADDLEKYPHPSAAEAGKAVQGGMSLFELKVPGVMTVEEIEQQVDLDRQSFKIQGRIVEAQDLVPWDQGDLRDGGTLKGVVGELVACLTFPISGRPIKNLPESITVGREDSAAQIFQKIADASRFTIHRLRVTKGSDGSPIPNAGDVTVHQTGLRNKSAIDVKDLGPQIAWRTVFVIEYLAPIVIHPLFYYARPLIYGTSEPPSELQKLTMIMVVLHFVKRELETLFVHRFSLATMPFRNIFKNSAHYWILSGFNMAYWIYAPTSPTARPANPPLLYLGIAHYVVGELGNLYSHLVLKNLRKPGGTERGIPQGLGFNVVTCPNYMFEIMAWVGVLMVSWNLSTLLFIVVSTAQLGAWGKKKERRYRKEFGDKYKRKRFVILPGVF
ncbi:hypothetical protein K491DRAFT_704316 [Lophiostoma macrostomum CBS 122681]|uniref:very-long-chain enoyl-CoA reductase n=1 Tax=Lophiostoma macrostomum CBS 122681 TaxID=1314788 RepID=A0A6A6TAJ1_9PLEO|nr:hypothetical protein K491DRAFT_704316 [Lophiostoma macrostomum CBS 122681]